MIIGFIQGLPIYETRAETAHDPHNGQFTSGSGGPPSSHEITKKHSAPVDLSTSEQHTALTALSGLAKVHGTHGSTGEAVKARDIFQAPDKSVMLGFAKLSEMKRFVPAKVAVSALIPGQPTISVAGLQAYIKGLGKASGGEHPTVALVDGKYHILEGHTRLAAQALAGKTHVNVHLYAWSQKDGWHKPT